MITSYSRIAEIIIIYILAAGYLNIDDLGDVVEAVWEAREKWYNIGLKLGISASTLDAINKAVNQNPDDCITAIIKDWLKNGKPKPLWAAVADALKSPMVGYGNLAEQLPQQNVSTDTTHSSSSSFKGKHLRSYSEEEDTPLPKKNKS